MGAGASASVVDDYLEEQHGEAGDEEFVERAMTEFGKLIAHDKTLAKRALGQAEQLLHGKTMAEAKGGIDMTKIGTALRSWQKKVDTVGLEKAGAADTAVGLGLFKSERARASKSRARGGATQDARPRGGCEDKRGDGGASISFVSSALLCSSALLYFARLLCSALLRFARTLCISTRLTPDPPQPHPPGIILSSAQRAQHSVAVTQDAIDVTDEALRLKKGKLAKIRGISVQAGEEQDWLQGVMRQTTNHFQAVSKKRGKAIGLNAECKMRFGEREGCGGREGRSEGGRESLCGVTGVCPFCLRTPTALPLTTPSLDLDLDVDLLLCLHPHLPPPQRHSRTRFAHWSCHLS